MTFSKQLSDRREQLGCTLQQIHDLTGIAMSSVSKLLNGKSEAKSGTLHALADALNANWVLVPKHLMPEVERLLSGKVIGPDDTPSTIDKIFGYEDVEESPFLEEQAVAAGNSYVFLKR